MQDRQIRAYGETSSQRVSLRSLVIKGIWGGSRPSADAGEGPWKRQMALGNISRLTSSSRDPENGKPRGWLSIWIRTFDKDRDPS